MKKFDITDVLYQTKYIDKQILANFEDINWDKMSTIIPLEDFFLEKYDLELNWNIILTRMINESNISLFKKYIKDYMTKFKFTVETLGHNTDLILEYKDHIFTDVDSIYLVNESNLKILDYFNDTDKAKIIENTMLSNKNTPELIKAMCKQYPVTVLHILYRSIYTRKVLHNLAYYFTDEHLMSLLKNLMREKDYEFVLDKIAHKDFLDETCRLPIPFKVSLKKMGLKDLYSFHAKKIF